MSERALAQILQESFANWIRDEIDPSTGIETTVPVKLEIRQNQPVDDARV